MRQTHPRLILNSNHMKPNSLKCLGLFLGLILAASHVQADEEQDLLSTLKSSADVPAKCSACQRLRVVGTEKCVPALATLLGEERISHAARYALEGLPFPEAVTAMRQALGSTSGAIKAGLIDSLGWRHDLAAVPMLTPLLADADAMVASAAASALGRIGSNDALAGLIAWRDKAPSAVQPTVLEALLQGADQLRAAGEAKRAAAIDHDLLAARFPERIRVAAWRGEVMSDRSQRASLVSQALVGSDPSLRLAALKVVREILDRSVVQACLRQWTTLGAQAQLAVLDAQIKLGTGALPVVRTATQSPHLSVRVAAWQALGDLGDAATIPPLVQAAAHVDPQEREAARDSLARIRGPGVSEALIQQVAVAQPLEKAELLRAFGERGDAQAANVLLRNAVGQNQPVRLAALESLRKLALPDTALPLFEIAAKSQSEAECEPVLKVLYAVCQASRDKDQISAGVLEAMGRIAPSERRWVLPLLAELGTASALDAAQAASRDSDPELCKQAVRVLAQWPNASAGPRLLELARTSDSPAVQVLALRGCIAVAGQEPDPGRRLALLRQAREVARHPEEKKQAIGQIAQVATPDALETVMADLANPDLASEAGLAALTIAEKLAATNPKLAADAAAQVLARCKTPEIVKRGWALRGTSAGASPFIQDWMVSGPYRQAGAAGATAVFPIAFAPEKPEETAEWKAMLRGNVADLTGLFPDQMNCVAYLKAHIIAPEDTDAVLLMGSDDGVQAWLNGKVVHSNNIDRGLVVDQDMAPIHLKKGSNDLLLKISQGGGGWAACARIVGTDGQPIPGLRFNP